MPSVSRLAAVAAHLRPRAAAAQQQQYSEQQPVVASPEEIQVLRGNGQAEPRNKPRGDKLQGYGIIGEQPSVFDPSTPAGFNSALEFYNESGYVVVQALSPEEIVALNDATDIWVRERGPEIDFPGQGQLFYPLLNFPEVDFVTQHPKVLPLVGVRGTAPSLPAS
jgi:hypothetical protein